MMEAKYLAEIKAREQAATPGPWTIYPNSHDFNEQVFADIRFAAHARTDIPELIAEVERLAKELAELKDNQFDPVEMATISIALDRAIELQFENATLKKALEMACEDFEMKVHWWDTPENEIYAHYIQQAQEQEGNGGNEADT